MWDGQYSASSRRCTVFSHSHKYCWWHTYQPKGIQVDHACTRESIPKGEEETGQLKQKDRPMLCRTFARSDPRSEDALSILQGYILHEFRFTPRDIACCLGNTTLFCRFIIKPSLNLALCEGIGVLRQRLKGRARNCPQFLQFKNKLEELPAFLDSLNMKICIF